MIAATTARRRATGLRVAVTMLTVLGLWAGTASATVIEQVHYSGAYSDSFDDCGFILDVEGEFYGQARIRADKGGQAFYAKDKFWYREILTNRDTGMWFVVRGNGLFNEVRATQVEGNVYEFVAVEAGQPFVIEDAAGTVVVRDRGVIRHTALFDTLGDGQPGGEFIDETSVVHGPHPGFADDFPFCEIAASLTGA